jgi:murein DD-endopeptidase MepM/ murein hydrolase activator NlpD
MKFNDLFRNRRNIYVVSLLVIALLLAGSIWQYNNYITSKMSQMDFEKQLNELDKLLENQEDVGAKIIDNSIDTSRDEPIKEVANTNTNKDPKTTTKPPAVPLVTPTAKADGDKALSAVKTAPVDIDTMIVPVFGTLYIDYSDTELMYSKTIDSWITHRGIDMKAEEGSPVRASLDGVVSETADDPQWGLTIVLDHGDGVFTKYCNLSTLELVAKGQKVKKGDVISGVGKTAICEIADEPHLHFELIRDNKTIDPKNYLPKKLK